MTPADAPALWLIAAVNAAWAYWTVRTGKMTGRYGRDLRRDESPYLFWGFITVQCLISAFLVIWGLTTFVPWPSYT